MNEQRKVVYAKRNQILDAADLRQDALEALAEAVDASIEVSCSSSVPDEWDLPGLVTEIGTYYPTRLTRRGPRRRHQHRRALRADHGRGHRLLRAA